MNPLIPPRLARTLLTLALATATAAAGAGPRAAAAQALPAPMAADSAARSAEPPSPLRPLRIAKWSTAAAAGAAAAWGFASNRRADDAYAAIERICVAEPSRCRDRLPGGSYADADLELRYQDVRTQDRRARSALIASQVGLATSAVLFILDLRNRRPPANIPYEVRPAPDGGLSLTIHIR